MASSISYVVLKKDLTTGKDVATEVPFENSEIIIPKQTAVDKIGGILCCICDSTFGNKKDFDSHYRAHNTGQLLYTCILCRKQHPGYPSFRNHCYLTHIVKDKFPCEQCSKSFNKPSVLKAHITSIHEFKCRECDEKFKTKKDLQLHKIIHNKKGKQNPPYNCTKCSEVIKSIDMCESHVNDHCEILYPCPICATVHPNIQEATLHLTEHFDEKITSEEENTLFAKEDSSIDILGGILCCHCDLLFKNRLDIESHFSTEHDDKDVVYSCNICEKQYTKYSLFGDHCYFHITKDKFQCEQCNRLFPRLPLLVMHNLAFHSEGAIDRPYRCDKCIYGFKSHYRLVEHKRLVHDEDTIKCQVPECSATFNTPSELIDHQRNHASSLENWCRECGLQFERLAACARHLPLHRRKLYSCPVCARSYRERHLVLKHLPMHFESVLHICKVCGRSYSARNRLIFHMKTHSEAKKYKCTYCSKAFARPHEREVHERVHTGDKPYRCTVCSRAFANYPSWTKHLTRTHAFDKNMLKQVREDRKHTIDLAPKSSPVKTESGIESAGSELSDLYVFMESDDSERSDGDGREHKLAENAKNTNIKTDETELYIGSTITDAVNAAIDTIDEDFELMTSSELHKVEVDLNISTDFTTKFNYGADCVDDSSDIKEIVEHIDALSAGMELPGEPHEDIVHFTEMTPVENLLYNSVSVYTQGSDQQYYQPSSVPLEYGPDFSTPGSEAYSDLINMNEALPHIDPLLTIKAEQNDKVFVENVADMNYGSDASAPALNHDYQPVYSTKVYSYDEANENRMYVLNDESATQCQCGAQLQTMAHVLACPSCPTTCTMGQLMTCSDAAMNVAAYCSKWL